MSSQSSPLKPTWSGYIESTLDALLLFEASLKGVISHVPRRPHDRERQDLIKSGSVFIYEEHSSGIKRWTDGVSWSPSRILGNFLIYRELEKPFPPGEKKRALKKKKCANPSGITKNQHTPQSSSSNIGYSTSGVEIPKDLERSLIGSLVDSYPFKDDGLVKKTISITFRGVNHHLVSYYTVADVVNGGQRRPSQDPAFKDIIPRSDLMTQQNFRSPVDEFRHTPLDSGHNVYGAVGDFSPSGSILQRAWHGGMAPSYPPPTPSAYPLQQVMPSSYMMSLQSSMSQPMHQPMPSLLSQPSANASSTLSVPPQQHAHLSYAPPHSQGNYSLDTGRASRFGSGPAIANEYPRQMPTQSSPRRHSNYEHGQPSDLMSLGPLPDVRTDGTNGASVVGGAAPYMHNSYYVPRPNVQLPAPDNHQYSSPASLRMTAGSVGGHVGAPDGTHPQYTLDENTGQWSFDTMEGSQGQDQQQPSQQDYYGRS